MHEIDKAAFGEFISALRKEKGYTQKELAAKLFVSDKAVSKWERGLSMPDISLLAPLADILDVSITELLEGRRMEKLSELDNERVETLVKKALTLSEDTPEQRRQKRIKNGLIFGACALIAFLEMVIAHIAAYDINNFTGGLFVMPLLSFIFGIYFWIFIKERLTVYYDENQINAYSDGIFRMNIPGVSFSNSNWSYIVWVGRIWSAVSLIVVPLIWLFLSGWAPDLRGSADVMSAILILYLAGLFVPMYIVGKKYESAEGGSKMDHKSKKKGFFLPVFIICMILLFGSVHFLGIGTTRSGIRIGYTSNEGYREWTASYSRLDGTMTHKIHPKTEPEQYQIEINTEAGSLSIEIENDQGDMIFSETALESVSYEVEFPGTVTVHISAEDHSGNFSITSIN